MKKQLSTSQGTVELTMRLGDTNAIDSSRQEFSMTEAGMQQRSYFTSQDVHDIQQLCFKKEMSVCNEDITDEQDEYFGGIQAHLASSRVLDSVQSQNKFTLPQIERNETNVEQFELKKGMEEALLNFMNIPVSPREEPIVPILKLSSENGSEPNNGSESEKRESAEFSKVKHRKSAFSLSQQQKQTEKQDSSSNNNDEDQLQTQNAILGIRQSQAQMLLPSRVTDQQAAEAQSIDQLKNSIGNKSKTIPKNTIGNNSNTNVSATTMLGQFGMKTMGMINLRLKQFFLRKTLSGRSKQLNDRVQQMIWDLSDGSLLEGEKEQGVFSKTLHACLEKVGKIIRIQKFPLFDPENPYKILFNSIIVSYNCFYLYLTSLFIFFEADFGNYLHTFHQVAQVIWILEMVVQMNTAMYHHNQFTTDRKKIFKVYFKEYFFFEIIPLLFEGRENENLTLNILLHIPLLLKLKAISIILNELEFYILQMLESHYLFALFKLILQMILLGHIITCCWSLVIMYELKFTSLSSVWSIEIESLEEHWLTKYFYGVYWSFSTMTNAQVLLPQSSTELVFSSCVILISCVAFGYLISSINGILYEISKENKEYKRDLNILNKYMKRKDVELGIIRRANISLREYYLQQRRIKFSQESETLAKLNSFMRSDLLVAAHSRSFDKSPFFPSLFSQASMRQIYTVMEEVIYAPKQVIFEQLSHRSSSIEEHFFYFVINGTIQIIENTKKEKKSREDKSYYSSDMNESYETSESDSNESDVDNFNAFTSSNTENSSAIEKELRGRLVTKGDCFGIRGFFTGHESITKAFSIGSSSILKVSRSNVLSIIKHQKKDFEMFMQYCDQLTYEKNMSCLNLKCAFCSNQDHESKDCYLLHFDKSNIQVVLRHNFSPKQERSPNYHRNQRRVRARSQIQSLSRSADLFRIANFPLNDSRKSLDSVILLEIQNGAAGAGSVINPTAGGPQLLETNANNTNAVTSIGISPQVPQSNVNTIQFLREDPGEDRRESQFLNSIQFIERKDQRMNSTFSLSKSTIPAEDIPMQYNTPKITKQGPDDQQYIDIFKGYHPITISKERNNLSEFMDLGGDANEYPMRESAIGEKKSPLSKKRGSPGVYANSPQQKQLMPLAKEIAKRQSAIFAPGMIERSAAMGAGIAGGTAGGGAYSRKCEGTQATNNIGILPATSHLMNEFQLQQYYEGSVEILTRFDKMYNFEYYFKNYNSGNVIKKFRLSQVRNQKRSTGKYQNRKKIPTISARKMQGNTKVV